MLCHVQKQSWTWKTFVNIDSGDTLSPIERQDIDSTNADALSSYCATQFVKEMHAFKLGKRALKSYLRVPTHLHTQDS